MVELGRPLLRLYGLDREQLASAVSIQDIADGSGISQESLRQGLDYLQDSSNKSAAIRRLWFRCNRRFFTQAFVQGNIQVRNHRYKNQKKNRTRNKKP